jgi:hypothetical protein
VTWKSSNANIASVDANGKVTAKAVGTVTITATAKDGSGKAGTGTVVVRLAAPTGVTVTINSAGKPALKWAKVTSAKGYIVYRSVKKDSGYKAVSETDLKKVVTAASYTDAEAKVNVYYYRVRAVYSDDKYDSARSGAVEANTLLAPAGLTGEGMGNRVILTWEKVAGATGYQVWRAEIKSGTYSKVKSVTEKDTVEWEDTKVKSGSSYYYKIKAVKKFSTSKLIYSKYSLAWGGMNKMSFLWPVVNGKSKITSPFGRRGKGSHSGIDMGIPKNTTIYAAASGKVTIAGHLGGTMGSYGRLVQIDHGNGFITRYGHNEKLLVKVGDTVKRGDKIALSGNTGNSTGPHCHFEVRYGKSIDPIPYLP